MENTETQRGKLYLIPTTLGDTEPLEVLPLSIKRVIENTTHFIVENEKTARRFIKRITPNKPQPSLILYTLNKYTGHEEFNSYLKPCLEGQDIGIISEAGCPGIADPGADIVALAHQKNIRVVPLVGPSSILLAMMGSGMNGQSFAFTGYLPIEKNERRKEIKNLERRSRELQQSQAFIETPYRNNKLLGDLIQGLKPDTRLCIATDITLASEYIVTKPIAEWKKSQPDLHKRPAIFIIHAS
ncbi:SAM-dependent methyltransferase [Robertkochia marina]|uniref:SAM-dependent methyltransferase n=1 Tax=Robertkochia marina TaxID=1227945 RepID=A0A4V3UY83_9FLAO|nr:SAM-dependent methyltransferase [Robertkochia marina]THD68066.1 SAM-dependent methyltransferase [Robertkochia marina]TRZ42649.1 SAM-dependent methyltransferase [Robertkochia marina]